MIRRKSTSRWGTHRENLSIAVLLVGCKVRVLASIEWSFFSSIPALNQVIINCTAVSFAIVDCNCSEIVYKLSCSCRLTIMVCELMALTFPLLFTNTSIRLDNSITPLPIQHGITNWCVIFSNFVTPRERRACHRIVGSFPRLQTNLYLIHPFQSQLFQDHIKDHFKRVHYKWAQVYMFYTSIGSSLI